MTPGSGSGTAAEPAIAVRDLRVTYRTRGGPVHAVKGVSLDIPAGRIVGLVGESGSGKSSVALAVMGALGGHAVVSGEVRYRGANLLETPERELRTLWGRRLAMVFQDPASTLNPVLRVGEQVMEVLRQHERLGRTAAHARMVELFRAVRLPEPVALARRYPHQLSGGQQQRVSIATALACNPDVLVLDEPTTGLDVTTEARILDLVASLRAQMGAGILYITHNLGVVARLSDEVAVMYAGEIVEHASVGALFARPRHPYTAALMECVPRLDAPSAGRALPALEGSLPEETAEPVACQFVARCRLARDRCRETHPAWAETEPGHGARCFFWREVAAPTTAPVGPEVLPDDGAARPGVLLEARGLAHRYGRSRALDGVSLAVAPGETLAVVGESGSGKTTLGRCLVGLLAPRHGDLRVEGQPVPHRPARWPRALRRRLQMVFQSPDRTLNPRRTVVEAVARPLELFGFADRRSRRTRAADLLRAVRLGERHLDLLPGELSGGERQRVAIARAFACRPDLVVCDEPTSALDVSVQATVLNLLVDLQRREQTSYVFISHDLAVVRHIADRVIVLYRGQICEAGPARAVFAAPYHPYTEILLSAALPVARPGDARLVLDAPDADPPAGGCVFAVRCPRKIGAVCDERAPTPDPDERGHAIACHIPRAELLALQNERGES